MSDNLNDIQFLNKLRKKQLEVSSIPQQDLGFLTIYYKSLSSYLKITPWKIIIPLSILGVLVFRLLTGFPLTHITSILQEGF